MPVNIPRLVAYEYCELKVDVFSGDPTGNTGIVRRSGSSLAAPEAVRGPYDRLLSELGASGWELKATRIDPNGNQVLIFSRAITLQR